MDCYALTCIRERTELQCMSLYYKANFIFAFDFPLFLSLVLPLFLFLLLQAFAWWSDLMVEHAETFLSLYAVDMDAALEVQPPGQLGQLPSLSAAQWLPAHWLWVFTMIFYGQVHLCYAFLTGIEINFFTHQPIGCSIFKSPAIHNFYYTKKKNNTEINQQLSYQL